MRFQLVDRVLERQPDRLVAIKTVTSAEEYLADHFPGFPVLPGVLMLESLVQAGRLLLEGSDSSEVASPPHDEPSVTRQVGPFVLADVRSVRYGNMVRPGQTLRVEVMLRGAQDGRWELAGVGSVDGQVAVQGRFCLKKLTPSVATDGCVTRESRFASPA